MHRSILAFAVLIIGITSSFVWASPQLDGKQAARQSTVTVNRLAQQVSHVNVGRRVDGQRTGGGEFRQSGFSSRVVNDRRGVPLVIIRQAPRPIIVEQRWGNGPRYDDCRRFDRRGESTVSKVLGVIGAIALIDALRDRDASRFDPITGNMLFCPRCGQRVATAGGPVVNFCPGDGTDLRPVQQ